MRCLAIMMLPVTPVMGQRFSNIDQPKPREQGFPVTFDVTSSAEGFFGGPGTFTVTDKSSNYELYAVVTVDDSQGVALHQMVFEATGRLSFDTHDAVCIDYMLKGFLERNNVDLNPLSNPVGNVIGAQNVLLSQLDFSGTYHNRSYTSVFDWPIYLNDQVGISVSSYGLSDGDLGIGFNNYPDELTLINESAQMRVTSAVNNAQHVVLEPKFRISMLQFTLPEQSDLITVPVEPLAATKRIYGDSNRDGLFDNGDLVCVFTAGQYEDEITNNSTWSTGDWNLYTEFDSRDFVVAFQAGTYTTDGAAIAVGVPEPPTGVLLVAAMLTTAVGGRIRKPSVLRRDSRGLPRRLRCR